MNVLLVSGYELGHQPYHLGMGAAHLRNRGHEVRCLDLSVDKEASEWIDWCDAVAVSVPMHTAARVGVEFARSVRRSRPEVPVAFYGLYASVATDAFAGGASETGCWGIAGEYGRALGDWVDRLEGGGESLGIRSSTITLEKQDPLLPARDLLPPIDRYARLALRGERRLVGYVEATTGCSHKCKHCPVPIVYSGRIRKVAIEALLEDIQQLVGAGASHITFGDPDFLNAPGFASEVVRELHLAFPELTFDCTAKVEHIIRHEDLWPHLARRGLIFVVSAFETTNSEVLRILDKGHRPEDFSTAVEILRRSGIEIRPSLLPFTPWSRLDDLEEIMAVLVDLDLVANVDPVQYTLKLLVPKGSLLLQTRDLRAVLGDYDSEAMSFRWTAIYPETIQLQERLADLARESEEAGRGFEETLEAMAIEIHRAVSSSGGDESAFVRRVVSAVDDAKIDARPRLTESWFCCAEPTSSQLQAACATGEVCA